jgi:hypothetical protein
MHLLKTIADKLRGRSINTIDYAGLTLFLLCFPGTILLAAPTVVNVEEWGSAEYLSALGGAVFMFTFFWVNITKGIRDGERFFLYFGLPELDEKIRRRLLDVRTAL